MTSLIGSVDNSLTTYDEPIVEFCLYRERRGGLPDVVHCPERLEAWRERAPTPDWSTLLRMRYMKTLYDDTMCKMQQRKK